MATTHLLIIALLLTVKCLAHSDEDADHEECRFKPCEPGFFCYKDTYRCAACIDCASRFRENSSFGCHQKAADCGACLPGYMEPPLEHDVLKESCMPQTTGSMTTSKTSSKSETEYVYDFVVFLTGVSLLSLFLMASFLYRWHKDRRVLPPQEGTELQELMVVQQQPPPPYSPLAFKPPTEAVNPLPSAPVLDSTVQIDSPRNCDTNIYVQAHRVQQLPPARVREQFQQAKASRCPNWVNPRHYQSDSPQSSTPPPSEDSSDGGFGETIHDENTQESHWTPNTSQENVEESASQMESSRQQEQVGSTAVGTIIAPDTRHCRDSRMGRRNSSEDVSSQESQDGPPREKRMRSASPPQQTRHFDFLNNNNINSNQMSFNQFNTSAIQINLNLNRSDIRRDPQELGSPLDSEDGLVELA